MYEKNPRWYWGKDFRGDPNFIPRYGYPFWVNGVPSTVKNFADQMEHFYKRKQEQEEYDRQAMYIQQRLTDQN